VADNNGYELDNTSTDGYELDNTGAGGYELDSPSTGGYELGDSGGYNLGNYTPTPLDPNTFSSGIGRGTDQMQGQLYSAVESLGEAFDMEALDIWGQEGRIRNSQEAVKYGNPVQFSEVKNLGDFLGWTLSSAGAMVPIVAANVAAATAGSLVGGPAGTMAGIAAVNAPVNIGQQQVRMKELQGEEGELGAVELATAAGLTAIDFVGVTKLVTPFMKSTIMQSVKDFGQEATKETVEKGLIKGGVSASIAKEAAQGAIVASSLNTAGTVISEVASLKAAGQEVDEDALWGMAKEAAAQGALFGAPFGSVGGYVKYRNTNDMLNGKVVDPATEVLKERNFLGKGWDKLTGHALKPIAHALTPTKSGTKIYNMFVNRAGDDLEGRHRDLNAELLDLNYKTEDIVKKYYGKDWQNKASDDYNAGIKNEATNAISENYGRTFNKFVKAGVVKAKAKIKDYSPFRADKDAILKDDGKEFKEQLIADLKESGKFNEKTFERSLAKFFRMLEGDANPVSERFLKLTEEQFDAYAFNKKGKADLTARDKATTSTFGNVELQRMFPASQQFYNRWSLGQNRGTRFFENMKNYQAEAAHRLAAVEKLGVNGEKLNYLIIEHQKESFEAGGLPLDNNSIKRIYDTVDAYNRTYGKITNQTYSKFASSVKLTGTIAMLPLVTLSSLTEPFNIAMRTDMSTLVNATMNVSALAGQNIARRAFGQAPTDRHLSNKSQASIGGQTLRQVDDALLQRIDDPLSTRFGNKIAKGFFRVTGLTYWTHMMREISSEASRLMIQQDIRTLDVRSLRESSEGQRASQRLSELGIGAEQIRTIKSGSRDARDTVIGKAVNRFNRDVVLTPSFSERPLWMSNQNLWFLSQLQGYPTMFTNTVLPMLGKKLLGAPTQVIDGLFIVGAMSAVGAAQLSMRDIVSGREDEREPAEHMIESLKRYMAPKPVSMLYDAYTAGKYGRSPIETFSGPTISMGGDIVKLLHTADSLEEFMGQFIIQNTPLRSFKRRFE
tara:strand:- start:11 stop:3031 length:3021 start_codon:yes stop_codon:yes gene_type:complete